MGGEGGGYGRERKIRQGRELGKGDLWLEQYFHIRRGSLGLCFLFCICFQLTTNLRTFTKGTCC